MKKRYWGQHFWARGYCCATVGEIREELIKEYLEHHVEPDPAKDFQVEPETRRSVDADPDFQSVTLTHRLSAGGC